MFRTHHHQDGAGSRLRRLGMLAGATTACILLASVTGSGTAGAATGAPRPVLRATAINLHQGYEKALTHAWHGKISGVIYPHGKQPKPAGSSAACAEPDCPVVYNGGLVQQDPKVYLLLWGPNWSTSSAEEASAAYLQRFYSGLGVQPQDTWSRITEIYGDGSGSPSFSGSVFMGTWYDTSKPPFAVTPVQLAAEADIFAVSEGLTNPDDQIVIATQSGTCPLYFACPGATGPLGSAPDCGWHANSLGLDAGLPFISLPYEPDGVGCDGPFGGPFDGFSIDGGHEYAETVTDPYPVTGWWDPNDTSDGESAIGGGEIADKCAADNDGYVTLSTGTFAMQQLFSNAAYAATGQGCTFAWPDNVTLTSPGSQSTTVHTTVSLQVQGTSSASYPLTFSASGLPTGLSIGSSTGLISGTPTANGIYNVSITAHDESGASSLTSFTWTIHPYNDTVSVTSPGAQGGFREISERVQITATSTGGYKLSYQATGLPAGLSINSSTGLISGVPAATGSWRVTVIATDADGAPGEAIFSWTINQLPCFPHCSLPRPTGKASPTR
jgi:hypothetical protein